MATKTSPHQKRMARVRKALAARGNLRPRLSVFRSSKNIYAQIIDDAKGVTLVAASSLEKGFKEGKKTGADKAAAEAIGKLEWAEDPKYKTHHARGDRQAELDALIGEWTRRHTVAEVDAITST